MIWIVPDFTVGAYRDRLRDVHEQIAATAQFVAHADPLPHRSDEAHLTADRFRGVLGGAEATLRRPESE